MTTREFIRDLSLVRANDAARAWLESAIEEIAGDGSPERFARNVALASRYFRGPLEPTLGELNEAKKRLEGWTPERWTLLDAARVSLVLAHPDLEGDGLVEALEEAFRFADVGELCALYRSLAHLPGPERFVWRAGEGCRTNMSAVFEANACDTPFPARHFDAVAWRQLVIKCLFIESPLWRVFGFDERVDAELARMALDLADERRSAHRPVSPELWMCLSNVSGERGLESIKRELAGPYTLGRRAAGLALARAGEHDLLRRSFETETDPSVRATMESALAGHHDQAAFRGLNPSDTSS